MAQNLHKAVVLHTFGVQVVVMIASTREWIGLSGGLGACA